MNVKMICLGAFAFAALSGAALAGALDNPRSMSPFFTDSSMKTMKSDADMKKVWMKMSKKHQAAMMKECNDAAMSKPHAEFCVKVHELGGKA